VMSDLDLSTCTMNQVIAHCAVVHKAAYADALRDVGRTHDQAYRTLRTHRAAMIAHGMSGHAYAMANDVEFDRTYPHILTLEQRVIAFGAACTVHGISRHHAKKIVERS
jgi:hypothetical protein